MNNYGYRRSFKILWPEIKANKKLSFLVFGGLLVLIGLSVCFNYWNKYFYNYLQSYDKPKVFLFLGIFIVLAAIWVLVSGFTSYWTRFLEFKIRESLYIRYKNIWLNSNKSVSNPEQRLAEDCIQFARISINFLKVLLTAGIKLPVFTYILISVASWWMGLIGVAYALLGTWLSRVVAKPLVNLEFTQQQREAAFRKDITYAVDNRGILPTLELIKENWYQLAKRNKYLSFFTSGYSQIAVILPYVMLLPLFLAKRLMLGDLFQIASGMDKVMESLSVLVDSRDIVVEMQMVTKRLSELEE